MYAFTVGGKNIDKDLSVAHKVSNWIIYWSEFNSVSVEQSNNVMSSGVSRVWVWSTEAMA